MKKYLLTMLAVLAGSNMWAQTFSTEDGDNTLVITTDGDMTAQTNADNVSKQMKDGNYDYSKVIVNGNGTISDAFLRAILYNRMDEHNLVTNTSLVNLDLTGITLKGWNSSSFKTSENDLWQYGQLKISELGLPKAEDNKVPDDAFNSMWGFTLKKVVIPEGTVEIGKSAFYGINSLSSVSFPSSLEKIDDLAFANLSNWSNVELNDGLEFIGNSAFLSDKAVVNKTLEIPATVKYIGPGAFCFRQYQEVYFLGKEAPMCPLGTVKGASLDYPYGPFGAESLMGSGGFISAPGELADDAANQGVANRENYKNGAYFCIMHFPNNLSDEQKAKYTDITKTYVTWEGNEHGQTTGFHYGATRKVGKETSTLSWGGHSTYDINPGYKDTYLGDQYIWPSQTQWLRSYITASNSLCWDGVTEYKPTLTKEQIALLREAGFTADKYSEDDLAKIAYVGTRQFVLGNGDVKRQTHDYPLDVKGGKWYTFCVPFNMTKKMIDEALGKNTQVCRFSSVERKFDNDQNRNHITLLFRHDVYKHKTEKVNGVYETFNPDAMAPADDDIVIYAHESYMIKPTRNSENAADYVVKIYEPEEGSPLPTYVIAKNRVLSNGMEHQSEGDEDSYRFIGNYLDKSRTKVVLPQYVYFFGRMNPSDYGQFWFYDGSSPVTWKSNSSIVQTKHISTATEDAESFFNVVNGEKLAKQFSIFGEDSSDKGTTGVETVTIVAGEESNATVYDLSGRIVSRNGDITVLPKGIYVKNGKKFIVK